jgi:predicted MFS family arabinose efflux permease
VDPIRSKNGLRSAKDILNNESAFALIDAFSCASYKGDVWISSKCAMMLASEGRPLISRHAWPSIFCLVSALFLAIATKPDAASQETALSLRAILAVAKQEHLSLATLGVGSALLNSIRTARSLGLPLWALAIGLSPAHASLYIAIAGGLDFALFYTSGQVMDKFGRRWVAVPTLLGLTVTFALLPFSFDDSTFLTVALLMSLANALGSGIVMVLGADLAPPNKRNEYLASFRLLNDMGNAAAPQLISLLTVLVSLSFAFFSMSGLSLIGALIMMRYLPKSGPAVPPKHF